RDAFSACTFCPEPGRTVIVYNPISEEARRNSDVAHELAHVLLEHQLTQLQNVAGISFFSCDTRQEDEAVWLAGCLLVTRDLLLRDLKRKRTPEAIARACGVSGEMVEYRINVTGARIQLARSRG